MTVTQDQGTDNGMEEKLEALKQHRLQKKQMARLVWCQNLEIEFLTRRLTQNRDQSQEKTVCREVSEHLSVLVTLLILVEVT